MKQTPSEPIPVKLQIVVGRGGPLNGFYNVPDASKPRSAQERYICSIFEAVVKNGIDIYFHFQNSLYRPISYSRRQTMTIMRTVNKGIYEGARDEHEIQLDRVAKSEIPADMVAIDLPERLIPWKKSHR